MVWLNCPDDSKKVWQLYIDFMLLVISLLTLLMSAGLNIPLILSQYVVRWVGLVLKFLTIYNTCIVYVSLMLLEKDLLTLSMGMGLNLPPFINPLCGLIGRPCPDVSKKVWHWYVSL